MAKVLLLNGSPHAKGCTATALEEMKKVLEENGVEAEMIHVGNKDIRGCISCGTCGKKGKCRLHLNCSEVSFTAGNRKRYPC